MPVSRLRTALLNHPLPPPPDPRPDGELLAAFLHRGDEAAFTALVVRHTPAVRAAGRPWLRSATDLDDVAQATFLVLVRRAHTIRDPRALPRWLSRAAANIARRLRKQLAKAGPLPADVPERAAPAGDDLADRIAEEVARLPEKYRLPVQLCYAAGLSTAEAADRLSCPRGTVLTRLARGRELVVRRLAARGVSAAAALAALPTARAVTPAWAAATARAAKGIQAGASPVVFGVSARTVTLIEGAVRAMTWNNLRALIAAAMLATGLIGFGIGQWASADPTGPVRRPTASAESNEPAKAEEEKPAATRRREAVIRMPLGTFVKEFDAQPYGTGRITWTYEEDRVLGRIEASVMGIEVELATEADISMSRHGTIYGLLTSVRLNRLHIPQGAGDLAGLQAYAGLWPLIEPLAAEITTDLPFSYQVRVADDRLSIHNFRMLLAGPNPLGKVAFAASDIGEVVGLLMYFQAIGVAVEGTYTVADAKDLEPLKPQPAIKNPTGHTGPPVSPSLFKKAADRPTPTELQPYPPSPAPAQELPPSAAPVGPAPRTFPPEPAQPPEKTLPHPAYLSTAPAYLPPAKDD